VGQYDNHEPVIRGYEARIGLYIVGTDGAPVTGATGLNPQLSLDWATLATAVNAATELGGGWYYLDLVATETDASRIVGYLEVGTPGAVQPQFDIIPVDIAPLETDTAQGGGSQSIQLATGASTLDNYYCGMVVGITSGLGAGQARKVISYDGTTRTATVNAPWATVPTSTSAYEIGLLAGKAANNTGNALEATLEGGVTVGTVATDAIASNAFADYAIVPSAIATGVWTQVASYIWAETIADHQASGAAGEALLDVRQWAVGKQVANSNSNTLEIYERDDSTVRLTLTYSEAAPTITRTVS